MSTLTAFYLTISVLVLFNTLLCFKSFRNRQRMSIPGHLFIAVLFIVTFIVAQAFALFYGSSSQLIEKILNIAHESEKNTVAAHVALGISDTGRSPLPAGSPERAGNRRAFLSLVNFDSAFKTALNQISESDLKMTPQALRRLRDAISIEISGYSVDAHSALSGASFGQDLDSSEAPNNSELVARLLGDYRSSDAITERDRVNFATQGFDLRSVFQIWLTLFVISCVFGQLSHC